MSAQPWEIIFYATRDGSVPAEEFLTDCPVAIAAKITAVLDSVAAAPPPAFSGGGMWEAMSGDMKGHYEVRVTGPRREQFRLFCLLDRDGPGLPGPAIVAVTGMRKPHVTVFRPSDYAAVREMSQDYRDSSPRRIA